MAGIGDELQLQAEDEGEFEDTSASGTVSCIPDRKRKGKNDLSVIIVEWNGLKV